ncbi:MAG: FtsX-like permease family protein [Anaerolineae bacterium]|nr:FtsX-like permease family protein [Anaerolineae bacterium]
MQRLLFYTEHSLNDLRIGRLRTLFAVLCIAAGVAVVVSLQTLGDMMMEKLTTNLQELNRGDINIIPPMPGVERQGDTEPAKNAGLIEPAGAGAFVFTDKGIREIERWIKEHDPDAVVSYRHQFARSPLANAGLSKEGQDETEPVIGLVIEVKDAQGNPVYPIYGEIRTEDGKLLSDVMREPTDIVVSDNAADEHDLKIGDQVNLGGAGDTLFTIRGIVPIEAEALTDNFVTTIFGFYYVDLSAVPLYTDYDPGLVTDEGDGNRYAGQLYVRLSDTDPEQVRQFAQQLQNRYPFVNARTTADLRDRNSQIATALKNLMLIMGLVSLLIGGVGIINTMLVVVARRTVEIAVLKTIGLQARQVTLLFMIESVMMGILGGVVGVPFGLFAAWALRGFAGQVWGTELDWMFSSGAVIRGFLLGIIITTIFGFLPTLIAGQVRPGNVLRPNDTQLPSTGIWQSLLVMTVIFVTLGLIAWTILGNGISPDPDSHWSIVSVGAVLALSLGMGGAAVATGRPFLKRRPQELGTMGRLGRYLLLTMGTLFQTGLQGVLFFAIGIILIALVATHLTVPTVLGALIVGVLIGLLLSLHGLRTQPSLAMTMGGGLVGFVALAAVGGAIGAAMGWPAYEWLHKSNPDTWQTIVDVSMNIALVEAALILVALLFAVLWLLVELTSRFPSMGLPDVKVSLRALSSNRWRVSSTLLGFIIGVLALSLVTMLAIAVKRLFEISLEDTLGGNVFVATGFTSEETQNKLVNVLETTDGVHSYTLVTNYITDFVELRKADGRVMKRTDLIAVIGRSAGGDLKRTQHLTNFFDLTVGQMDGRSVTSTLPDKNFDEGNRQLNAGDVGERVVVITGNEAVLAAGIEAGDILVLEFPSSGEILKFRVVGVSDERLGDIQSAAGSPIYAPIDAFSQTRPNAIGAVVDIDESQIGRLRRRLSTEVDYTFVIEAKRLSELAQRLIDQFTLLPFLVSILTLITGGVVIANSVALSTMERRREIGIMKSLGVQRERVLSMLLIENGLMGFLGGLIGVGASVLLLIQIWAWIFEGDLTDAIPIGTALGLMALCIGISVVAAMLTAWGASGEKPLNVLRYE